MKNINFLNQLNKRKTYDDHSYPSCDEWECDDCKSVIGYEDYLNDGCGDFEIICGTYKGPGVPCHERRQN